MRGGLARQGGGWRDTSAPHHPAAGLRRGGAAVGLGRSDGVSAGVLAPRPDGLKAFWSGGFHDGLQAAVVGMGVAIFGFMRAGTRLVGRPGLILGFSWFDSSRGCENKDKHI